MSKKLLLILILTLLLLSNSSASSVKQPEFDGQFYPAPKEDLSRMIDQFLD